MRGLRGSVVSAVLFSSLLIIPAAPGEVRGDVSDFEEIVVDVEDLIGYFGLVDFDISGGGETVVPYGTLDAHGTLGGQYLVGSSFGILDLSLNFNTEQYYDFQGHLHTDEVAVDLDAMRFLRNIEHRNLPLASDTSAAPLYTPDDRDPADDYGAEIGEQSVEARWKVPGYPAHVRVLARQYTVEGERQQVFLNENCTTNCHNVSMTRRVDTTTRQMGIGADAHAGYVDISYNFKGTRFEDNEPDPVFGYDPIFSPLGTIRAATTSVHNAYPDMKSSRHELHITTNATGRWTGGMGWTLGERENDDADLTEEFRGVSGYLTWRPSEKILLSADSRQILRQDEAPRAGSQAALARITDGLPLEYGTLETRYRASMTYYPTPDVKLKGKVSRAETEREDEESWGLPDCTTTDEWGILGRFRLGRGWILRVDHNTRDTSDPEYDTSPTGSRHSMLESQWTPLPNLAVVIDIRDISDENTDSGRVSERLLLNAGVTYSPSPPVNLGLHLFRYEDDVDTDLTFDGGSGTILADPGAPYRAESDHLLFRISWAATESLQLTGAFSHLDANGSFRSELPQFSDVGDYSRLEVTQVESSLDVLYRMKGGWSLTGRLAQLEYEDRGSLREDEEVRRLAAVISKRW
ncbi:MAG: hypothetical protein JSV26_02625 [bacterium]|nr:MAG: hypothetical protein JSV26_02625 [bacterium]